MYFTDRFLFFFNAKAIVSVFIKRREPPHTEVFFVNLNSFILQSKQCIKLGVYESSFVHNLLLGILWLVSVISNIKHTLNDSAHDSFELIVDPAFCDDNKHSENMVKIPRCHFTRIDKSWKVATLVPSSIINTSNLGSKNLCTTFL